MGCFLGCFGGDKEQKRRKKRVNRASPQRQRNRIQNVQQEIKITVEQSITETTPINLVSESPNKTEVVEQPNRSPKKRVTFNSNVTTTTYEHVSVHESIDSLPECPTNIEKEKQENPKASSESRSNSEDDNSITSSVASYPPNHRYHNARDSDDEAEEYGDSDLDDDYDEEDYDDDYDEEDHDVRIASQEVWSESVVTTSMESRTGNPSSLTLDQEVESPLIKSELLDEEIKAFGSKTNARDRSDYINSVLNPVENISQWKAVKSRGTTNHSKPQKENLTENLDPPRISFTSEPIFKKKSNLPQKSENQEISVDASLSNWLGSPEITKPTKKTSFSGFETTSEGRTSVRSFEDRPILGALTVEELRHMNAASASPRKSPSRSPDEVPIIGTVGSYWNHSDSAKSVSSFKGIPNTTSKYREDKRVNWHSTPFETRLDRALHRGDAEA